MNRLLIGLLSFALAGAVVRAADGPIVADTRAAIARGDIDAADRLVTAFRAANGTTPEMLEAMSWVGRGALAAGQNERAATVSRQTRELVIGVLKTRRLDADTHLPVALGAAIETEAKAMVANGQRASAVLFLGQQLELYRTTPIRGRLQKNLHLLSLVGQPAPPLRATEHLGAAMPDTKGRPVLLFFWAHWCPDCKAQAPIVADLQAAYRSAGLIVVGPTRRYGYAAAGVDASPAVELAHIEQIRRQYYGTIDMAVPVSDEDALSYGMDATPTLVLVDRNARVALYHPGGMTRSELEPYIRAAVQPVPPR